MFKYKLIWKIILPIFLFTSSVGAYHNGNISRAVFLIALIFPTFALTIALNEVASLIEQNKYLIAKLSEQEIKNGNNKR